jgi:predicted nucleotidyltransferase
MSGSLVQRGEIALFSKYDRAEMAVRCGADAVFELPSVYSNAPANVFAFAAVCIIKKLSGVDYICFGSECGDLELLEDAAEKTMGEEFNLKLSERIKANKNKSYPSNVYGMFCDLYGEKKASVLLGSNNILAIEYLKALKKLNAEMTPVTIKRTGADFNSEAFDQTAASAAYIRKLIRENTDLAGLEKCMPEPARKIASGLIKNKKYTDTENLAPAVISHLCRLEAPDLAQIAEIGGGLEHRIKKALDGCCNLASLYEKLQTKHRTASALRRAVLNAFFGITNELQNTPPDFTAVLALNQKGAGFIRTIRKKAEIEIITKPADMKNNQIFDKNLFIDNICKLALHNKEGEINEIRQKPRVAELKIANCELRITN